MFGHIVLFQIKRKTTNSLFQTTSTWWSFDPFVFYLNILENYHLGWNNYSSGTINTECFICPIRTELWVINTVLVTVKNRNELRTASIIFMEGVKNIWGKCPPTTHPTSGEEWCIWHESICSIFVSKEASGPLILFRLNKL